MINAVGREIPGEILKKTGKEPFKGAYANDNHEYKKAAPTVRALCDPGRSKMVENIHEALVKCGIRDGMTLSFHHHFREGTSRAASGRWRAATAWWSCLRAAARWLRAKKWRY